MKPVFVLGLFVVLLAGCGAGPGETVRPEAGRVTTVPVERVGRHDLTRELDVAAEFRPFQEVEVHAKVAGYLKSIAVDVGDHVAAGGAGVCGGVGACDGDGAANGVGRGAVAE